MKLERIDTNFTEVLDGQAFSMMNGAMRVIVIVANETLVRMDMPMATDRQQAFLYANLPLWQDIASAKYDRGAYENRGSRVRLLPADMLAHRKRAAA